MKRRIRNLVFEVMRKSVPLSRITDSVNLSDDLGFDSLMFVSLVSGIEKEFKVKMYPDDINLENLKNIQAISMVLDTKIRKRGV